MTPEELASTFEGHAASCDRQAVYQRNRERHAAIVDQLQHRDLAVTNEAKAETLREVAGRIRKELTQVQRLLTTGHHVIVIDDVNGWVIEHTLDCRFNGRMADCAFTVWARENINGSRIYPTGRFTMNVEDPHYMTLEPTS